MQRNAVSNSHTESFSNLLAEPSSTRTYSVTNVKLNLFLDKLNRAHLNTHLDKRMNYSSIEQP